MVGESEFISTGTVTGAVVYHMVEENACAVEQWRAVCGRERRSDDLHVSAREGAVFAVEFALV
jgi:hypothetical protein